MSDLGAAHEHHRACARRTSRLAVASTALGVLALVLVLTPGAFPVGLVGLVTGVVGLVLGVIALRSPAPGGRGRGAAVAGVVLGSVSVVVAVALTALLWAALTSIGDGPGDQAAPADAGGGTEGGRTTTSGPAPDEGTGEGTGEGQVYGQAQPPEQGQDGTVVTEVAAPPVPDPAARVDFSSVTCDLIGDEAVSISQATADLPVRLVDVRDTRPVEDRRPEYPLPEPGGESTVMSCRGTADWDDGASSSVYLVLTVDPAGVPFVAYLRE